MKISVVRCAVVFMLLLSGFSCSSQGPTPAATDAAAPRVFVDRKSKTVFIGEHDLTTVPVHPKTGKATLSAALYCPQCRDWHPVPPLEVMQRQPHTRLCPKTKSELQATGPLPGNAVPLPAAAGG